MLKITKNVFVLLLLIFCGSNLIAQPLLKQKQANGPRFAGIEVGSKGVKMTLIAREKSRSKDDNYQVLKDTSVNTDFISFSSSSYNATLQALTALYQKALNDFDVPAKRIFTVVSSGVKVQAAKDNKSDWITKLASEFKAAISESDRKVVVVDVIDEAKLSHLGIVPEERRNTTFLIDIGSGNTKGGYFNGSNTSDFKLFQLTWGTKSVSNAAEKRSGDDLTIQNFDKNVNRVVLGEANTEIVYAVNVSNAYNMSDYVAFSGGIAWATATLLSPELADNPVVPVTYDDVVNFRAALIKNYAMFSDSRIVNTLSNLAEDEKTTIGGNVKTVNKVFDQKAMLAGTALLLNIMRQFEGVYEKKQFFLVKNGQVGWISAYVNQSIGK